MDFLCFTEHTNIFRQNHQQKKNDEFIYGLEFFYTIFVFNIVCRYIFFYDDERVGNWA